MNEALERLADGEWVFILLDIVPVLLIYIYWKKSIPIFYVQFLLQFYCGRVCACPDPFIQSLSCFISVFNVHATLIMVNDCFSSDH